MYRIMVRALTALHRAGSSPEYVGITCLITCYMDAIAAGGGSATRCKFEAFLRQHFRRLCDDLGKALAGRDGAHALYRYYRNGLAHNFFTPDARFALAEDEQLDDAYAGHLRVEGRRLVAVNIDRLYRDFDFLTLARSRANRPLRRRFLNSGPN